MVTIKQHATSENVVFDDWNIFFDVDGTLTSTNLFDKLAKKFNFIDEYTNLLQRAASGEFVNDFNLFYNEFISLLNTTNLSEILSTSFTELATPRTSLVPFFEALTSLFPGINIHLLSGGFIFHCQQIAELVGTHRITNIFSNTLSQNENFELTSECNVFDKAQFIEEYYQKNLSDKISFKTFKEKSFMIGDGFNDLSAMQLLSNSIAICPTYKPLADVAKFTIESTTRSDLVLPICLSRIIEVISNKTI